MIPLLFCVKLGEDVDDSGCLAEINAATITYAGAMQNIISSNCNSCHGDPVANGAVNPYVTRNQVVTRETEFYARINRNPGASDIMPPSGKLDSCTIARFSRWRELGFPE